MGCPDACVRESPNYTRVFCVFCKATICTKSLGRHADLARAEWIEVQKIKTHCKCCKEYQRAIRSGRVAKGQYLVKYKFFTPKEFK